MKSEFMDTFIRRVHDVDMKERTHATTEMDAANLKELGYGNET